MALKVAWIPDGKLGAPEWAAVGRRFGTVSRCSQWWIGDWIRYGVAQWGEKYAEAARITGYDTGTLRNMAWVASQFDLSLRNDELSWSHHALLAPLSTGEKKAWLNRAVADRFSVADLRAELRGRRAAVKAAAVVDDGEETAAASRMECPHCGKAIDLGKAGGVSDGD